VEKTWLNFSLGGVATYFKGGGICNDYMYFIANLPLNVAVKIFQKSVNNSAG